MALQLCIDKPLERLNDAFKDLKARLEVSTIPNLLEPLISYAVSLERCDCKTRLTAMRPLEIYPSAKLSQSV